ncbi:MAG: ribosome silencing factor [Xenococcaceae cyanobacterium]
MTANDVLPQQSSQHLAWTIAQAADDRKAEDIVLLRVAEVSYLTDYFVIATGFSKTQVQAISDSIKEKVEKECQKHPMRIEGKAEGTWILQDYGDVIVHIFLPQEREFYNLEAFWGHAERIDFPMFNPVRE